MKISALVYLFYQFMATYNVTYETSALFETRFEIFALNMERVDAFSAPSLSLGLTPFADRTEDEFRQRMGLFPWDVSGDDHDDDDTVGCPEWIPTEPRKARLDWREEGVVSPIKDQGACGSCWAFATVETAESVAALSDNSRDPPPVLSPMQLVDCSTKNHGCSGGNIDYAMLYVLQNGLMNETTYPYHLSSSSNDDAYACVFKNASVVYRPSSCFRLRPGNEKDIRGALEERGPLVVAIEASAFVFQMYNGGIIRSQDCGTDLDHAVQLVGYGEDPDGVKYWIVRNSWGERWGEQGYFRLERTDREDVEGTCGMALGVWGLVP
jgi:C1A family cysteine protease